MKLYSLMHSAKVCFSGSLLEDTLACFPSPPVGMCNEHENVHTVKGSEVLQGTWRLHCFTHHSLTYFIMESFLVVV